MKKAEIKPKSNKKNVKKEKKNDLSSFYDKLYDYKLKVRSGEEKNYSKIKFLKKEIARELTKKNYKNKISKISNINKDKNGKKEAK